MVVGAGFGGIAAGVKLKQAGIHTFTIYESSLGIGGTWWDNTYPGAEVDVGSHLYCFSFKPHDWTRTHARQPELQKYLEETVDEFGLRPHLRLGVAGRVGDVGRRPPRLDGPARRRDRRRVPRARERGRLPQRAPLPRLARARRLRRARVPHRALGAPARPDRQGRGRGRHRLVGHAGRARHPADRGAALRVPARAGLGHAQGRARPHRRGAGGVRQAVAAPAGALAAEVPAGEEPLARAPLPARHQDERGPRAVLPRLHRPPVRRPPRPARGRHADVPVSRQAAGLRQHLLPRAQEGERRARPPGGGLGDPHRHRRRRRGRASRRRHRDGHRLPAGRTTSPASASSAATAGRCRSTGRASRAPTSASPCPGSRTSSCSTGRAPTAARS